MTDEPSPTESLSGEFPLLPLRDLVVFPAMVVPLFVGRDKSIAALEQSMAADKRIVLVAQRDAAEDDPGPGGLYPVGTLSNILQMLKLPDGTVKVLVEGVARVELTGVDTDDPCYTAWVRPLASTDGDHPDLAAMGRSVLKAFEEYVKGSRKTPPEVLAAVNDIDDLQRLADTVAGHIPQHLEKKQALLETTSLRGRMEKLLALIDAELDLLQVEQRMRGQVRKQMEKSQREYYLHEQMKAIQKELGDLEDAPNEIGALEKKIEQAGMPKEAAEKTRAELAKLKTMSPMSAEATVVRNYIDWMLQVPWKKRSRVRRDLPAAEAILDTDHYGLEKVKERIVEFLAVQQRVRKPKGPILCLVGPPGVGKTSLGKSIARATNRRFTRMSLGGVRDEAEIRGHRRTYIGSLPGKIVQNLAKVGVRNPVFMLDEIDKMAMDFRGDPASALLEVLDPEQNHAFNDHYLEADYDLSDVMFVATANTLNIPAPLLDRMEVIRISGYTDDEKLHIARRYLVPKSLRNNGLKAQELTLPDNTLRQIIAGYTREAGVRNLEREITKICRKAVRQIVSNAKPSRLRVTASNLEKFLGVVRHTRESALDQDRVGHVNGLAWTQVGGELLTIEAVATPGKGQLTLTGQLGDVMQESIKAALTVVRSRAESLGLAADFHAIHDFHVHVPQGAIPKDGPSAGIGMCVALVSALTARPVRACVAMTGEITLRGEVLAIGGLKEKLLAARTAGITQVLIPAENQKDLAEIQNSILRGLQVTPVRWIDDVLSASLAGDAPPRKPAAMLAKELAQSQNEHRH